MTPRQIIEKYMKANGMHLVGGNGTDCGAIMPWLIMDVQYQLFWKEIHPLNCGHSLQQAKTRWEESYNRFNRSMFSFYNSEEKDYIVDLMAEMEDYLEHDVTIALIQFENKVMKMYEPEEQRIIASCMLCHVLATCAQIVYGEIFRTRSNHKRVDKNIEGVEIYAWRFANIFHEAFNPGVMVSFNDDKNVGDSVAIIQKKIVRFFKEHSNAQDS